MLRSLHPPRRRLLAIATRQGGYFTTRQALVSGYAQAQLHYHVRRGNFRHAGHGLYRMTTVTRSPHDALIWFTLWSRGRDQRPQGVVSHVTALALHGLAPLGAAPVHLTVPPHFRKRAPPGCVLHHDVVGSDDRERRGCVEITSLRRTYFDLTASPYMPFEDKHRLLTAWMGVEEERERARLRLEAGKAWTREVRPPRPDRSPDHQSDRSLGR